jgi:hypothetical protein
MRLISSRLHALLDYAIALFSIVLPVLLGLEGPRETMVLLGFGLLLILYSLFTDYALGMSQQIPLWLHFRIDQVMGLMIMVSPWVMNFNETIYMPHVLLGLALIVNSLLASDEFINLLNFLRQRPWDKWLRTLSRH